MAQPPSYNREKNFADDFGNETDHSALNAELDRASNSINDIRTNLAILQADDGKLRPAVVTADSISEELRVSLVEGVVMDAQSMLDRSLAAADASSAFAEASSVSAKAAKASEEKSLESSSMAGNSAKEAADSAKAIALAINSDWDATEGAAEILNKPALSAVALSGNYEDLSGKPDNLATDDDIAVLQEEIAKKGVPVGTVEYFATTTPPAGYLKADGAAVGRETYPDLYAAIGTTFGEGDGSTTFNLPDLIDRFAQGSNTPGQKLLAGLPNIDGEILQVGVQTNLNATGAFFDGVPSSGTYNGHNGNTTNRQLKFDASRSNPIYGASNTVQPPALTLLPCIKAFDAATNPGLIDITELANEVATHKHVTETYNDGTNWYRKWSDGWLEQGGHVSNDGTGLMSVSLLIPFSSANYCISITSERSAQSTTLTDIKELGYHSKTAVGFKKYLSVNKTYEVGFGWYACGQGAQS